MLHIIKHFPVDSATLKKTSSGDTVVLTENAVLAAKRDIISKQSSIRSSFTHINLCVLKNDLKINGISTKELAYGVSVLDDQDLNNISREDEAIRSWN